MIGYTTIGTSDLKRLTDFYDAVLAPLGLKKVEMDAAYTAYASTNAPVKIEFYVTKPFDQNAAIAGSDSMIALRVEQRRTVELFHQIDFRNHGLDAVAPGLRPLMEPSNI